MKVLLVNGSPRETENTYQTLRIISECLDKYGQEILRTLAANMSFMLHQMENRED